MFDQIRFVFSPKQKNKKQKKSENTFPLLCFTKSRVRYASVYIRVYVYCENAYRIPCDATI